MLRIQIDGSKISDWDSFHEVFSKAFGFPDFYGKNMNAWIDCLSGMDDPGAGMTRVHCAKGAFCLIEIRDTRKLKISCPDVYQAILECSAFVNFRKLESEGNPLLMLSFDA